VLTEPHYKVEGMLRGHPWLIMSKGRMGFGYDDYLSAAPELSPEVKVLWLAVHRDLAEFAVQSSGMPVVYINMNLMPMNCNSSSNFERKN
jgi:siderophore synthetase component